MKYPSDWQATNEDGIVNSFISEGLGDQTAVDEEAAKTFVMGSLERIGGDETTELVFDSVRSNADGMTVYTFTQRVGELFVPGATVKLVTSEDGVPLCLISSVMPQVEARPLDEWAVDAKGAEKAVKKQLRATKSKAKVVKGATDKVIVPSPKHGGDNVCAWVVYTMELGAKDDVYTAHYVGADGDYLYAMPVPGPSDPDAATGQRARNRFDFDAYEPGETSAILQAADGTPREVSLPVLKDSATGKTYLADAKRQILCTDMAPYYYRDEIVPIEVQDGIDPIDANVYHTFIRAWDFYDSVGWTGPDGEGTPTMLLMNFVEQDGTPLENAAYLAKADGFQVFGFTRLANYGNCLDVVGHEFTHCVTGTAMAGKVRKGDPGAINEGMSDILGNLIEMRLEGDAGAWTLAEGLGEEGILRSMSDPHAYAQPEFVFDTFYAPCPPVATDMNDRGGEHTNASLLSIVSYRLYQAGMSVQEQGYFWMNAALTMSPQSDYPMLAEILPWVMRQAGYPQHVDALKKAIEGAKWRVTEDPGMVPEGCGVVTFDFAPIREAAEGGRVCLSFFRASDANPRKRADTWPIAGTTVARANLPAGSYFAVAVVGDEDGAFRRYLIYGGAGWQLLESKDPATIMAAGKAVSVRAGETVAVPNDSFGPVAAAQLELIEQALAEMAHQ